MALGCIEFLPLLVIAASATCGCSLDMHNGTDLLAAASEAEEIDDVTIDQIREISNITLFVDKTKDFRQYVFDNNIPLYSLKCMGIEQMKEYSYWVKACVCYLYCNWRNLTVEESTLKAELRRKVLREDKIKDIIYASLYGSAGCLGFSGNVFVLISIFYFMGKPTVTNILIASMSMSDLLCIVVFTPLQAYYLLNGFWPFIGKTGVFICYGTYFLYVFSLFCSVYSLTAMNFERYLVICYPLKVKSLTAAGFIKRICIVIWIFSAVLAIPLVYLGTEFSEAVTVANVSECFLLELRRGTPKTISGGYYLFIIGFLIPVMIIGFSYVNITMAICSSITQLSKLTTKTENESKETKERIKVVKMLFVVFMVFICCWGPQIFHRFLGANLLIDDAGNRWNMYHSTSLLTLMNSTLNPFLYALSSKHFRRGFMRAMRLQKKKTEYTNSSNVKTSLSTVQ